MEAFSQHFHYNERFPTSHHLLTDCACSSASKAIYSWWPVNALITHPLCPSNPTNLDKKVCIVQSQFSHLQQKTKILPMLQCCSYYYYLFTAIGFAPGGSGPYTTQLQQKNIQYQQQKTKNTGIMAKNSMNNCQCVNHLRESVAEWEKTVTGFGIAAATSGSYCTGQKQKFRGHHVMGMAHWPKFGGELLTESGMQTFFLM
jgi:hypothetical protein